MANIGGVQIAIEVVERLMKGDPEAQEQVFKALSGPVYSMALRIMGDSHAAEDVAQDTFMDVLTKAHTIREPSHFVGWVRTLAVNRCYMRLRSPWHRRRVNYEPVATGAEDATSEMIDVERALAVMDPKTRLVVWMYCVEGYTHEEIGKLLKRSTSYSKVIISRLNQNMEKSRQEEAATQQTLPNAEAAYSNQWNTMTCQ
ncbi:MAG: RNA polymerase sigma factor [Gammaproteobacteria bacterium]|nr:RNA polymerase sigma factor [Gammaproteobacteria bacterium]